MSRSEMNSIIIFYYFSGSDGLLKIWTIKSNECTKTYDQHEDKVWALTVNSNEDRLVTGAGDSTIIIWKVSQI